MDAAAYVAIAIVVLGVALWGLKKYQDLKADGKITLSEVVDAIQDGADVVEEAIEDVKEIMDKEETEDESEIQ